MHLRSGLSMPRASSSSSKSSSQAQPLQATSSLGDLNVSTPMGAVGTKGVSQNHLLSFHDNKVLKIVNWIC